MKAALQFIAQCNGWHTFAADVRRPVQSLARIGLVEVNEFRQFRITRSGRMTALGLVLIG